MSQLSATMRLDVLLQARSQLYAIGVVVAAIMGLAGRFFFGPDTAPWVLPAFFLVGIGGTTYMFGASLVLLEKGENTLQALKTTPLTSQTYLISKALTLTSFAALESALVYAIGFFGAPVNPVPLVAGIVLLGVFYTMLGLGQVSSHESVTSFLIPTALVTTFALQLPVLFVLDIGPDSLWYLIPTQAPLLLMMGAFQTLELWQWAYAIVGSFVLVGVTTWWATRRFAAHIRLQEG